MEPRPHPTILLVDDHRAVRDELAHLLEEDGMAVCGQAGGRVEALACAAEHLPDLALVDLSLDNDDGLALVADLHKRGILVVVCSTYENPGYVQQALDLGARAYVAKRDAGRALVRTLRDVLDGWVLVSPRAAGDLPNRY